MKKEFKILLLALIFSLIGINRVYAVNENAFDLFALVENVLSQDNSATETDNRKKIKQNFDDATNKFNQGNVAIAYDEYLQIAQNLKNDFALLNFAKCLYKKGLFSLGDIAISKIRNYDSLKGQIQDLKASYHPNYVLNKDEEIYLAKAFTSIHFDNSAQETLLELNKKSDLIKKSDYANYIMSQAFFELKQYPQSLNYIENSIKIMPKNINYNYWKAKVLNANKNYKQALKITKNKELMSLNFANDFRILEHSILSTISKKPTEKKYQNALSSYYSGDYYKTISECKNAISLNKNNLKAINLLAKAQLKIKEIEAASYNYNLSYNAKKTNGATIGLGDIGFIKSDFDKANNFYKKAYKKSDGELTQKLILTNEILNNEKVIKKYKKNLVKIKEPLYFGNFEIATTLLNNVKIPNSNIENITNNMQAHYLKDTLVENPFYSNAWYASSLLGIQSDKRNLNEAFMQVATLSGDYDFMYYYALAQYEYARKNYEKTIEYLNAALTLNPKFEPANKMLLNLKVNN